MLFFFFFFFFRFYENYFPEFLHLIDLFNDNLCFDTFLKQLNFFADIPVRGHSGPLQTLLCNLIDACMYHPSPEPMLG